MERSNNSIIHTISWSSSRERYFSAVETARFTAILYFTFPEFLLFSSTFSLSLNEKRIFSWLLEGHLTKNKYLMNFFEPELLKRKTKFVLTTKCYMTKYDKTMNQALLQYHKVEKKCKNFLCVFPECFDIPRNFLEFFRFSLIF